MVSKQKQMEKAIESGDFELAAKLLAEIKSAKKKPKKKRKVIPKAKGKKPAIVIEQILNQPEIAPSKSQYDADEDDNDEQEDSKKTMCRIESIRVGPRVNQFVDDKTIAAEERITLKKNKHLAATVSARNRPKFKKIKVVCSGCGKRQMVSPALAPRKIGSEENIYKCNNCCVRK